MTIAYNQTEKEITHRENHHNPLLPLHNNTQIKPHLKPPKRLVDENILHRTSSDKPRAAAPEETRARRRSLHSQTTHHEQRLGRVTFAQDEPEDQRVHADS